MKRSPDALVIEEKIEKTIILYFYYETNTISVHLSIIHLYKIDFLKMK